jgi:hypothetical protein
VIEDFLVNHRINGTWLGIVIDLLILLLLIRWFATWGNSGENRIHLVHSRGR